MIYEGGAAAATLRGRLRHEAADRAALPAVGDWVAMRPEPGGLAMIEALLERRGALVRNAAGQACEPQVIGANLDVVFVLNSLNQEFNLRRLERYLVAVRDSNARPVVVLTKADLVEDPDAWVDRTAKVALGVPVRAISTVTGREMPWVRAWVQPGQTVALVGSSGVGKSTLVNELLGREAQATAKIREGDGEGRHTTTGRHLFLIPGGGLLLDTPGMRELQLWAGDEGDAGATKFEDIAALARECRFRDCSHDGEAGCAVAQALEAGELEEGRLRSWRKLQRELSFARDRQAHARAQRQRSKRISRANRSRGREPS